MAWMGEPGLRRRNRWTRYVQQLVKDDRETNWLDSFARYRLHVDRALDPSAPPPGHDLSKIEGYADKLPDGTIRWLVYDSSTAHAAEVQPQGLISAENVGQATALLESLDSDELGIAGSWCTSMPQEILSSFIGVPITRCFQRS